MVNLRRPTDDDLERFKVCLAADPDHAGQDPDSWTAEPGEFWTFYDEGGNRVWVRIERVLRVSIQHDHETPRRAIVPIIYKGFAWMLGEARSKKFTEVIFESRAKRLIAFVQKMFGFAPVNNNFYVRT